MRFTIATALLASVYVSAQSSTTHTVMVGLNQSLTYNPSNITAAAGDIVTFVFASKNHTVTQSTFAAPCTQLTNTTVTPNIVGISSGFVPVANGSTDLPTWSFSVTDTTPLWFFCLQANHCQQGMVFSINANANKTYDAYLAAAKLTTSSVPNPQTLGAATSPQNATSPTDVTSAAASSTAAPNGSPSGVSGSGSAPSASTTPGAAPPSLRASSVLLGSLAVLMGVAL